MSIAQGRERRANAGSKMAKLLDEEEEEDEFYKTAYGGFDEIEDDNEFEEQQVEHEEDYVDSDFDIDETEEPDKPAEEDEDLKRKRSSNRRGVVTKAYKVNIEFFQFFNIENNICFIS